MMIETRRTPTSGGDAARADESRPAQTTRRTLPVRQRTARGRDQTRRPVLLIPVRTRVAQPAGRAQPLEACRRSSQAPRREVATGVMAPFRLDPRRGARRALRACRSDPADARSCARRRRRSVRLRPRLDQRMPSGARRNGSRRSWSGRPARPKFPLRGWPSSAWLLVSRRWRGGRVVTTSAARPFGRVRARALAPVSAR
jgi:hypothetical protein